MFVSYRREFGQKCSVTARVTVSDVVYIVNYLFKGGPAPSPFLSGDANCDGSVNITDVIYLINYLFKGGTAPCS